MFSIMIRAPERILDDRPDCDPAALIREARRRTRRRRARAAVAVVLTGVGVALLAGVPGGPRRARGAPYTPPSPPPAGPLTVDGRAWAGNGMLAFVSRSRLYVLSTAGRLTRVSGPPAGGFDSNPGWSADGAMLAFLHTGQATGWSVPAPTLWVLARAATRATEVTTAAVGSFHWSPRGAVLAYVANTHGGALIRAAFAPRGASSRLASDVGQFTWSPDGRSIAVVIDQRAFTTVEVIAAQGGRPDRWYQDRDACITLASWSPDGTRIAAWVDSGCNDPADGEPLDVLAANAAPRRLSRSIIDESSLSWSPDGHTLAYVTSNWRSVWGGGHVLERCPMSAPACTAVPTPAGDEALQPAFTSSGALDFVTASSSGPFAYDGDADWAPGWIAAWQRTSRAWELAPSASAPTPLPASTGNVLAFAPAAASSATLLARDDALWLAPNSSSAPVEIADPLLAETAPSGYYGELDWAALFAWSASPAPSEVPSQASATLPDELEIVPNPPSS
jgi:dipeptidyl aminopeptidase/acylaminoacyl peptidase